MLKASIQVQEDCFEIEKLFSFEDKEFQNKRAKYTTKIEKDVLTFSIKAKDSSALRSVLNTITKLLSVYEKTKMVLENERNGTKN